MKLSDPYLIDTPEQVTLRYELAGMSGRILAALVDTTLIVLLQVLLATVVILLQGLVSDLGIAAAAANVLEQAIVAFGVVAGFAIIWGYYLTFELLWNGQTPGKRWLRLRVIRDGGRPISFLASAIRNLIRVVDFLPFFYGIGVLVMFVDPRWRRLGDIAAGTLVVREEQRVKLQTLVRDASTPPLPPSGADSPAPFPVAVLSDEDYALVSEFLRRRHMLVARRRHQIGIYLAGLIQSKLAVGAQELPPELFLEQVAQAYRDQQEQAQLLAS